MLGGFDPVTLALIGRLAGLAGGMLGIGGSLVMIPALTELLGPDQHLYQAAAMIVSFFVVVPAVYQHHRAGAVEWITVRRIVPAALLAVIVGVVVSESAIFAGDNEAYLSGLFGLFLFSVSGYDVYRLFRRDKRLPTPGEGASERSGAIPCISRRLAACVAVPTGLVAGLLGVGGGVLAVPLQRRFMNIPMRKAIANSATVIIATSLIGAAVKNYAYFIEHDRSLRSFALATILIPTAILGSMAGSRLTHRLPIKYVKTAFFLLLSLAANRQTYEAATSVLIGG